MKQVPDGSVCVTMNLAPSLPKKPPTMLLGCTCLTVHTSACPLCGLAGQVVKAIAAGQAGHCFISDGAWQHQSCNPKILG